MAYFSTQTSIETRASSYRLKLWADKDRDDTVDSALITAACKYAQEMIYSYCVPRFGETEVLAWQTSTPSTIEMISDDLCLWFLTTTNPAVSPLTRTIYTDAIELLGLIRDRKNGVYGATEGYLYDVKTQAPQPIFDDELTTELEDTVAEEETFVFLS